MTNFNALKLLATVSGFKLIVRANRFGCKTGFARDIHDKLITRIDDMTAALCEEIRFERELAANRGTPEGDADYELYFARTFFEARWQEYPISVLDQIEASAEADGEKEWAWVFLDYTEVPAAELEGLAEVITAINHEVGTRFVVARVEEGP